MKTLVSLVAVLLLVLPTAAVATDAAWPQWRGPDRDGRSPETGLLRSWPEGGPKLLWRASGLGAGYSSLSIADGRIFTMGDLEASEGENGKGVEEGQYAIALAEDGGEVLWRTRVGPRWEDEYVGARATPTVDGDRVYAMSTEGTVVALDAASGKVIWKRSLPDDFGGVLMKAMGKYDWKFVESPLVDGPRVIVTPGAPDAALVALDKKTGKEIWRTEVPALGDAGADGAGYSSAVVSEAGGVRQYVQLLGRGVVGIEAETGRFLWGYNRVANDVANIPTPLIDGDRVFVSSGYGTGAALLRIHRDGEKFRAEEVYFLPGETFQNHHGGMILHDGHVYTGTGHNKGFPIAVELMSGKVVWGPERNAGQNSAALTFADGLLFFRYQNGVMVLAEATPEGYRERGSFEIPEVDQFSWSHPVIADGKLFLREQDNLFVYDIRAANGS